ncbi:GNAT family N-acetyltransferase [Paenibacillus rhizophilus]|uniref:GNAT family N-acetyltransferase n=1 Tax=Paenibacillus rhizophilus TaxID=1850366 RepID=A0A3N9P8H1_9BACL|nr:GNAT family N-acetyltransferase [Paenibacillus rhizophilus]RQW12089.1 GNAT family N-acetyltransferase [Paenibacillus rhizophilus]
MKVTRYVAVRAGLEDLEKIVPLFDGYRIFYRQESDRERVRAFLEERLNKQESVIFLAVEQEEEGGAGRAVGFTQLYPSFSSVTMQRLWILNDLYVSEEARGSGAGAVLMEAARAYAQETGTKGLTLTTWTDNFTAQRLYEKQGYIRDDEFYSYNLFF